MVDEKPGFKGGDAEPRSAGHGEGSSLPVPPTEDHKTAAPPEAAALTPPSKSAKPSSVPSRGTVADPPHDPAPGLTVAQIFDQRPSGTRSSALSGTAMSTAAPSRGSVPSSGAVLGPPAEPVFGFTLSQIFGPQPSSTRSSTPSDTTAPPSVEDPGVAQAMERGEKLFPDVMKASGHEIRRALASIMPVTFESLSNFGADELARVAGLVRQASSMTEDIHKIDAAEQIRAIVAEAERMNAKPSLLDLVGIHSHFDLAAANENIGTIRGQLTTELYEILKTSVDLERAMIPLNVVISVTRILADMEAGQTDMAALIGRKANLFAASAAEVDVAKKQLENLRKLAQEGILQCDELKTVTLPAMGFRQSL